MKLSRILLACLVAAVGSSAYAAKFNEKYKVNAARVTAATNVWTDKVSDSSSVELQSATCYNQKSYYGW